MLRFIALRGVRAHENMEHLQCIENVIYRDRSHVEQLLLQLENKHMYSLFICSLCNVAFPMACFTCIVTSQVFVEI